MVDLNRFPCKCSHLAKEHVNARFKLEPPLKLGNYCVFGFGSVGAICVCDEFQPDNLKYLEQIYESNSL